MNESPSVPLLKVENLTKHFRSRGVTVYAVNGVSFEVRRGEAVALVGESGCGKSTVARCILRLLEPTGGRIEFLGREVSRLPGSRFRPLRRRVQMVFQDPTASLNPSFTVRRTLREPLVLHNITDGRGVDQELVRLMHQVNLEPTFLRRRPRELSGGQKQRVGIARAIATRPDFVVLDEPTSSLDMSVRFHVLKLLQELQRELGMTYLFITHDLSTVQYLCNRVLVMYLGKIVEEGDVDQVFSAPLHPYTRALISAIPVPDPRASRERIMLPGETPSATRPITGCPFQDRCAYVMAECRVQPIPQFEVDGRRVACLLYQSGGRPDWLPSQGAGAVLPTSSPREG